MSAAPGSPIFSRAAAALAAVLLLATCLLVVGRVGFALGYRAGIDDAVTALLTDKQE